MKKKLLLILSIFLCFFANSFGQINFTDSNFKNALLNHIPIIDTNGSGQIEISEASAITRLELDNKNISNLEGIEHFINLEVLKCSDNNIQKINTENLTKLKFLTAERNLIKSIDVRNCILWTLRLSGNPIEYAYLTGRNTFQMEGFFGIDFGYNQVPNMKYVCISQAQYDPNPNGVDHRERVWNRLGSALHIGECTIQTPTCPIINFTDPDFKQGLIDNVWGTVDTNGDGEICIEEAENTTRILIGDGATFKLNNISDISEIKYFTNLEKFIITGTGEVTNVDISNNKKLYFFSLNNNKLSSLNTSNNPLLQYLYLRNNKIKSVNLLNNPLLTHLSLEKNLLTSLNISKQPNLSSLEIADNQIPSIDIRDKSSLVTFNVARNKLTSLDVTNNFLLKYVNISHNNLGSISIKNNKELIHFYARDIQITDIDLSENINLTQLYLHHNYLKKIDISNNNKLVDLFIGNNLIKEIDIRNCNSLDRLLMSNNLFLEKAYLSGNHSFYQRAMSDFDYFVRIENCPNLNFVCLSDVAHFNDIKNYITGLYPNCTVSTNCDSTAPVADFNTYFSLSPNPTTGAMWLTRNNSKIGVTKADIYNVQTGAFVKTVDLIFSDGLLLDPFKPTKTLSPGEEFFTEPTLSLDDSAYIDCNDVQKGTYILKVYSNRGTFSTTFIKSTEAIR